MEFDGMKGYIRIKLDMFNKTQYIKLLQFHLAKYS